MKDFIPFRVPADPNLLIKKLTFARKKSTQDRKDKKPFTMGYNLINSSEGILPCKLSTTKAILGLMVQNGLLENC